MNVLNPEIVNTMLYAVARRFSKCCARTTVRAIMVPDIPAPGKKSVSKKKLIVIYCNATSTVHHKFPHEKLSFVMNDVVR